MPRKGPADKRPVVVDPVYESPLVTQLVNKVLLDGKRSTAERIVYGALEGVREKTGNDPVVTLRRAVDNVRPDPRGALPPRRRCHVPGAGRGARRPQQHPRPALDDHVLPAAPREDDDRAPHERDCSTRPTASAPA